ncbi:MAG: histidine phosphatase family protein [Bacteroidota bacterium]
MIYLHSSVIVLSIFFSLSTFGQRDLRKFYREVEDAYKETISRQSTDSCRRFGFVDTDQFDPGPGRELLQIMILRHQKVDLVKKPRYNYFEAYQYLYAYDTAQMVPVECNPVVLKPFEIDSVYGSNLRRSKQTADLLFEQNLPVAQYPMFREYKNNPALIPTITLPINMWRALGTLRWVLGINDADMETFDEARRRTKNAAAFLDHKAVDEKKLVLIGHGFFNIYLKRSLKKMGWKVIHNGGFKNLGVSVLVKVEEIQQ